MSELKPFDEFMDALVHCDTVKVILTGCGESTFETKPIYEGICALAYRRAHPVACEIAEYAEDCKDCGFCAQPANEPLTIEQLKQMDGEPVWVKHFAQTKFASAWIEVGEYGLVDAKLQRIVFMKNAPVMFEKYKGDFAIAYDHKQGGEQE
jgi:hypothetical protein